MESSPLGHLHDLLVVFLGIGIPTGNDKLLVRLYLLLDKLPGFDKVVDAFLGNDAGQEEDIVVLLKTVSFRDEVGLPQGRLLDAIGNIGHGPMVIGPEIMLDIMGKDNDLVGILHGPSLSVDDDMGGQSTPLGTLPIQAMDRDDKAEFPMFFLSLKPQEIARHLAMDMDDIIVAKEAVEHGEKGIDDGIQALGVDGEDLLYLAALVVFDLGICDRVFPLSVVKGDILTQSSHARGEVADDHFDSASPGRDDFLPHHGDSHLCSS